MHYAAQAGSTKFERTTPTYPPTEDEAPDNFRPGFAPSFEEQIPPAAHIDPALHPLDEDAEADSSSNEQDDGDDE
jgi:hypothetical protein